MTISATLAQSAIQASRLLGRNKIVAPAPVWQYANAGCDEDDIANRLVTTSADQLRLVPWLSSPVDEVSQASREQLDNEFRMRRPQEGSASEFATDRADRRCKGASIGSCCSQGLIVVAWKSPGCAYGGKGGRPCPFSGIFLLARWRQSAYHSCILHDRPMLRNDNS